MTVNKTETTAESLRINRLNQTQFSQASDLPVNELYFVDPEFTGNKVLTTDATGDIVEADVSVNDLKLPSQTGQSGKYLTTDGTVASWATTPEEIPSQTDNAGKVLETNGTAVSWGYRAVFRTWED